MAIRAEVSWCNSARWLEHKPSELSTPAEIRGLDRFSLKCEGKTRRSVRMSLRAGHLCGRSSESVVKLECKRSVSGSFATVSPVRWEIERRSAGATVPGGWSTSLLISAHLLRSEGLTALYHYQLAQRTTTLQKRTSGQYLNDTDPNKIYS